MRRPLSGALLGILIGLAVAIVLQQHGVWPLDKLAVFLLPGVIGLLGMLATSIGREGSTGTMVAALIITLPLVGWGLTGLAELNEQGQLNGGCEVVAASDIDSTTVTDSSRSDPFDIDPEGGLTWVASSPTAFDDYAWEMWTEIGGFRVPLDSEDNQDNDAGDQDNTGDVSNVTAYAETRGIELDQVRGSIIVGGEAATCDGFGFVRVSSEPFETLASQIAAAVGLVALIALLIVAFTGREVAAAQTTTDTAGGAGDAGATSVAGGPAAAAGLAAAEDESDDHDQDFVEDLRDAARESGFGTEEGPDERS